MKNIEIFQQFKKDHHALKTEDGQFLYKLFHTPEQILPFTPLEPSPSAKRRKNWGRATFICSLTNELFL
jgi:hypothetical protein